MRRGLAVSRDRRAVGAWQGGAYDRAVKRVRNVHAAVLWYIAAALWPIAFLVGLAVDSGAADRYMLGLACAFVANGASFEVQGRDRR
jgi:hypothetical protein